VNEIETVPEELVNTETVVVVVGVDQDPPPWSYWSAE
jgi:hypothetical protein